MERLTNREKEIPTTEGYKYSTSENIEHISMIDD